MSEQDSETIITPDQLESDMIETTIKQELESNLKQDKMIEVKIEKELMSDEITKNEESTILPNVHVKEELRMDFDKDAEIQASDQIESFNKLSSVSTKIEPVDSNVFVKQEMVMGEDTMVSYDYPSYEDSMSMDSADAAVLGNVETCLQEDYNVKTEEDPRSYGEQQFAEYKRLIKQEAELVTETHLISNKLINTTSTITNPQDGLIESQTTKTLVMEILPLPHSNIGIPEEILPTTYEANMDYEDMFQLNSITGNVMSLEQEAYGLLKAKKNTVQKKVYVCQKCNKEYRDSTNYKNHMNVHKSIERRAMGVIRGQQTKKENRLKRLKEESCDTKPKIKDIKCEVDIKQEVKREGYECTCGQIFQRRSRMETCLRSHDYCPEFKSWHQCTTCLKQYKDKMELTQHRRRAHRKKFQCKFCPTDYGTPKELFKHLQLHQKVQLMEYKVISEVVLRKQKLRCFMCSNSYSEISELKSHVMDDHKSPFSCPMCQETFTKIIEFCNHMKTSHTEVEGQSVLDVLEAFSMLVKAWKCEECGLQFHEADKLALHQVLQHSPDLKVNPQYQCPDCRRVFVNQKGLTSHRRVHHSETVDETEPTEKGMMCLECRKMCKDMDALTSHMRLHSPERKYPCKFCDFRFATPEKRKAHAEIHTGDMKYVCFICEYQCSSENRLMQHKMSLKHVNMKEFLLTGKPLLEEQQSTSKSKAKKKKGDRKKEDGASSASEEVTCDICGETFESQKLMLKHKQTHPFIEIPSDDKPTRIFFK